MGAVVGITSVLSCCAAVAVCCWRGDERLIAPTLTHLTQITPFEALARPHSHWAASQRRSSYRLADEAPCSRKRGWASGTSAVGRHGGWARSCLGLRCCRLPWRLPHPPGPLSAMQAEFAELEEIDGGAPPSGHPARWPTPPAATLPPLCAAQLRRAGTKLPDCQLFHFQGIHQPGPPAVAAPPPSRQCHSPACPPAHPRPPACLQCA